MNITRFNSNNQTRTSFQQKCSNVAFKARFIDSTGVVESASRKEKPIALSKFIENMEKEYGYKFPDVEKNLNGTIKRINDKVEELTKKDPKGT